MSNDPDRKEFYTALHAAFAMANAKPGDRPPPGSRPRVITPEGFVRSDNGNYFFKVMPEVSPEAGGKDHLIDPPPSEE